MDTLIPKRYLEDLGLAVGFHGLSVVAGSLTASCISAGLLCNCIFPRLMFFCVNTQTWTGWSKARHLQEISAHRMGWPGATCS